MLRKKDKSDHRIGHLIYGQLIKTCEPAKNVCCNRKQMNKLTEAKSITQSHQQGGLLPGHVTPLVVYYLAAKLNIKTSTPAFYPSLIVGENQCLKIFKYL